MANRRRSYGEGSIYYDEKRKEYIGSIRTGQSSNGRPVFKKFYSGKNGKKAIVVQKMNEWRLQHENDFAQTHDVKLSEAIKVWAEICKKPDLKPASYDRLESIINCQIIPRIGWRNVGELTDAIIRAELLTPMIEVDGLSVSTAKKAYNAMNA